MALSRLWPLPATAPNTAYISNHLSSTFSYCECLNPRPQAGMQRISVSERSATNGTSASSPTKAPGLLEKMRQKDCKSPREVGESRAGCCRLDVTGRPEAVLPVITPAFTPVEWGGAHGPHPNWGYLQILMASRQRRDILQGCAAW